MCEHPKPDQRKPACKGSGIHPIFCACNDCTQKIDRWKAVYNEILSTGPQDINQLNLNTTDKTFLPVSPTLLQHNEHKEEETHDEEPDRNKQIQDVLATIEGYDDQIDHTLKIFGEEYTKEQTTDFISRLQEKDVIINTTMFSTKASQFKQEVNAGKVRKSDKSYFFFINLKTKEGTISAVWDSGSLSCVALRELLEDQSILLNQKLTNRSTIQTVGGDLKSQDSYQILLPIMDSNYNYQLANCVTVPRIVNKIPTKNLSAIMKRAYREYTDQCESNGDTPVEPHHWPDGTYGGTIQLLLGVGSLDFKVIFNYRGLVFI